MSRYVYNVHNLRNGGSPVPAGYTSWLEYWEKNTGEKVLWCKRLDCLNAPFAYATDGAHVQLDDPNDNHWYIVPLCHMCNCQFGDHFQVYGPLVRVTDPTYVLP